MRLLFIGDTHGTKHLGKVEGFLSQSGLTPKDAIIHCGDAGFAWLGEEDEALRYWRGLPMKVLVCLGNHENYHWLAARPLIRRFGALGYDLGGSAFAPLHGQVARLGGKSLWFYPGGYSIDFYFRTPGRNVHVEEMLPHSDAQAALHRVLRRRFTDFIVSHDGPRGMVSRLFGFPIGQPHEQYWAHMGIEPGSRAHPGFVLEALAERPELFGQWYFGHHHQDIAEGKLRCLWHHAALVDTVSGQTHII